jgi:hypothetical protein
MSADHDDLLDSSRLIGLSQRPIGQIRSQRAACLEVEGALSYVRRLVQGSLDIVEREWHVRDGGGAPESIEVLVNLLPEILGEVSRPPGNGRLTQTLGPTELSEELASEFESLVGDGRLARAGDLSNAELDHLLAELQGLEARISSKRRAFHDRIDVLQSELTRRYQSGEASIDALLHPS